MYIHISTFICVLISFLEIKSFDSSKIESSLTWKRVDFKGDSQVLRILSGVIHKREVLTDLDFFLGGHYDSDLKFVYFHRTMKHCQAML